MGKPKFEMTPDNLRRLYEQLQSFKKVAHAVGVSPSTVYHRLITLGIITSDKSGVPASRKGAPRRQSDVERQVMAYARNPLTRTDVIAERVGISEEDVEAIIGSCEYREELRKRRFVERDLEAQNRKFSEAHRRAFG